MTLPLHRGGVAVAAFVAAAAFATGAGAQDAGTVAPEAVPPARAPVVSKFRAAPSRVPSTPVNGRRSDMTFGGLVDRPAVMHFELRRQVPGRRRGTACVAPTRALIAARARGCVRLVRVGSLRRRAAVDFVFVINRSRLAGRDLAPGTYVARVTAVAGGRTSVPRTARVVILPPAG